MAGIRRMVAVFIIAILVLGVSVNARRRRLYYHVREKQRRDRNQQYYPQKVRGLQWHNDPNFGIDVNVDVNSNDRPTSAPTRSWAPSELPTSIPSVIPSEPPSSIPSTRPSGVPSETPTISNAPTSYPSDFPSVSPTLYPTEAPSEFPSVPPSDMPSAEPSSTPTGIPSQMPSFSMMPSAEPSSTPTGIPSQPPTMTAAPTKDPKGFDTIMFKGPDGLFARNSTCRPSIPSDATNVQDQVVTYDYTTNVQPGSNVTLALNTISLRLQSELSQKYLECNYQPGSDFYVHSVSSLPPDTLGYEICSGGETYDCYTANGAYTATIFYLPKEGAARRRLVTVSTTLTDPNVFDSFSNALEDIFASDALTGDQVMSTTYGGEITNAELPGTSRNVGAIVGGVVGGVLGVALLGVALYAGKKRHRDRRGYIQQYSGSGGEDQKFELEKEEKKEANPKVVSAPQEEKGGVDDGDNDGNGDEEEEKQEVVGPEEEQEQEDDQEDNREDFNFQEDFDVVVVNDEEETFASIPIVRRPENEPSESDDLPQGPRFLSKEEYTSPATSPRVYVVKDTIDL